MPLLLALSVLVSSGASAAQHHHGLHKGPDPREAFNPKNFSPFRQRMEAKPQSEKWILMDSIHGAPVYRRPGRLSVLTKEPKKWFAEIKPLVEKKMVSQVVDLGFGFLAVEFNEDAFGGDKIRSYLESFQIPAVVSWDWVTSAQASGPQLHATSLKVPQWHLDIVRATKGLSLPIPIEERPIVGILDTGVDLYHPDLQDNLLSGVTVLSGREDEPPMDFNGHGTMVAGIIAAGDNDFGVLGVAPNALISAIKILDDDGHGSSTDLVQGVLWAIENAVDILNISAGTYAHDPVMEGALRLARSSGLIVVASAGNDGVEGAMYPAKYEGVLSVASTSRGGWISPFSNWGNEIDMHAPGGRVITTTLSNGNTDPYGNFNGTSASAAYVSGLIARSAASSHLRDYIESILHSNVYLQEESISPDRQNYRVLHTEAVIADVEARALPALKVTSFSTPKTTLRPNDNLNMELRLTNIGTTDLSDTPLEVVAKTSKGEHRTELGTVPALARGEVIEQAITIPISSLVPSEEERGTFLLHLFVTSPQDYLKGEAHLVIRITEESLTNLTVSNLHISPLEFFDSNTSRSAKMVVRNDGNQIAHGLSIDLYDVPARHEGVSKEIRRSLIANFGIESMSPGESREVVIPLNGYIAPQGEVTFWAELKKGGQFAAQRRREYFYGANSGELSPQYAQTIHRKMTDDAIRLLKQQGIIIPELHHANSIYRGSPLSYYANDWGLLPFNSYEDSGFISDENLEALAAAHVGI